MGAVRELRADLITTLDAVRKLRAKTKGGVRPLQAVGVESDRPIANHTTFAFGMLGLNITSGFVQFPSQVRIGSSAPKMAGSSCITEATSPVLWRAPVTT